MNGNEISLLLGKTITGIDHKLDELIFTLSTGERYKLHHQQDCCENVTIEDIAGELDDLIGSPITMAEEAESHVDPAGYVRRCDDESFTWTFYKLATVRGYVTIRWYGESNGYYSESVDFDRCE